MRALCPIRIPGRPGTLTPATSKPGADRATSYQTDGTVCGRCGSPASSAPPVLTAGPFAAQALLSGYWCSWLAGSWLSWASSVPAAVASALVTAERGVALAPVPVLAAVGLSVSVLAASGGIGVSAGLAYGPGSYGVCAFLAMSGNQSMVRAAPRERSSSA